MPTMTGVEAMEMMGEFRHFRKSGSISVAIVGINRFEEEGDALYTKAVRMARLKGRG